MHIGVIGCGYWGPNLIRNLVENKEVTTLTVCDKDSVKLQKILDRYPTVRGTKNSEELFADASVVAVVIATPASTHHPLGMKALQAGKHVFIEKPMATSAEECKDLIAVAKKNNCRLMVGHTFMYSPPVLKIKEEIDEGTLGNIYYITASRVNLGLHQKDVSVIWDLAPHDFSILFYWLGERPVAVSALGGDFVQKGIPDVAFINMQFASGCVAHVQVSWLAPSKLRRTTLVGDRKMLVYDDTESFEKVKIYDKGVDYKNPDTFGEYQLSYRTGDIVSPQLMNYEPLGAEMGHFLNCVKTGATPRTDGESGLMVVETLQAAEESLRSGGKTVTL